MVFRVIHSRSRYWPLLALCGHEALAAMERIRIYAFCRCRLVALDWSSTGGHVARKKPPGSGALLEESDEATDEEADEAER